MTPMYCFACGSDRDGCEWCTPHEFDEYAVPGAEEIAPLRPSIRERVNQAVYNFVGTRFGTICLVVLFVLLATVTLK